MPQRGRLVERAWALRSSNKLSKHTAVRYGWTVNREKEVASPSPCLSDRHEVVGAYCNTPLQCVGLQVFHSSSTTFSDGRASTACCPFTIMGRCISTGCCSNKSITASRVTYMLASRPSASKFLSFRTRSAGGFGSNESRRSKVARSRGAFRYSITSNSTPRSRRISSAPRDCPQPGL